MNDSQSLTNNLLMEVDVLSNRLRNIRQSFKATNNKALKERLFSENKNIFNRVNEIYKIADLLNKKNNEPINFSKLLLETTKRTLNENKSLKDRLFSENKNIFKRVSEIYKIAEILNKTTTQNFNFSNLLFEKTTRTLYENKFESNLFFL